MPKINVYLPEELSASVRDAQLPVSAICQAALEQAVRDVSTVRASDESPAEGRDGFGLFRRFTPRARHALQLAEQAARDASQRSLGTEHLLLGVLTEGGNLALGVLESLDVEPDDLRAELAASMGPAVARSKGRPRFTPLAKAALERATKEALGLGHNYIGCEHLLLGLLATEEGLASKVMRRMGLELRTTRRCVVAALVSLHRTPADPPPRPSTESTLEQILARLDTIEQRIDASG
jgi:ATP-dependent Clp protease ATP-binding subunit ClpA